MSLLPNKRSTKRLTYPKKMTKVLYLLFLLLPRLVISDKGPVENSHRACKHSLHWAGSHALSHRGPKDGHRLGAAHITKDDRWLHTTRSIRLHPPIDSEGKTRQLLSEVLNHIIPLKREKYITDQIHVLWILRSKRLSLNVSAQSACEIRSYLRLSMNQDINIKLFLELDNFVDFLLNSLNIIILRDPAENALSNYTSKKWTEHGKIWEELSEFCTS